MVDIHTHILPHLDDGAQNIGISEEMLAMERAQGVNCVVFTPHYYGKYSPQQFLAMRKVALEELKEKIPDGMEVRVGAEVHFTGINVIDFDELCTLAIEGTKYILLEFPFTSEWSQSLMDTLADFISDTGYTPIVAHVERYIEVLQNPSLVSRLVDMGCLIQVNAESFCRKISKKFVFALLKHGLIHCIGTDAHDAKTRPPAYLEAKAEVEKAGYLTEWEKVQKYMKTIVRGGYVRVERGKPVKKIFGRYV